MSEEVVSPDPRSSVGATFVGGAATVACVLPVFLTGAMAVQLTGDLAFGAGALGVAVAMFRMSSAVGSVVLGRVADRLDASRSLQIAMAITVIASVGLATTAQGWSSLVAWLIVGGLAHALGQPAVNRLLTHAVPPYRLGLAVGIKQSAPPAASMLAGLSVPVVALTLGWRAAFLMGAVLAALAALATGRRRSALVSSDRTNDRQLELGMPATSVVLLATGFGFGTAASSTATTFYVDAAVKFGTAQAPAGVLLAASSLAAILVRILFGIVCDRTNRGHLGLCACLLGIGSLGFWLLATATPVLMGFGIIVALSGTWGFTGIFWYAVMRLHPKNPGAITGALAPGGLLGAALAPIVLGFVAEQASYPAAWGCGGVLAILAASVMLLGMRRLT